MKNGQSTLQLLPFYNITYVELLHLLETVESFINSCLENQNITKLVQASIPDHMLIASLLKHQAHIWPGYLPIQI